MIKFLLVATLLLLAGCATQKYTFNPGDATAYLSAHRDRPSYIANALSEGKLAQGMNEAEVQICWGKPDSIMTQYQPNQRITTWSYVEPRLIASSFRWSYWGYEISRQAVFVNGVLSEWRVIQTME